jgi:hypothetical protein
VLDVACGTGVVTRLAGDHVGPSGKVTGLDPLAEEVSAALGSWLDDDGLAFPMISHIVSAHR